MREVAWDGSHVPEGETEDSLVTAWQVTPHVGDGKYDVFIERSGPSMLAYVEQNLEFFLERFSEEELRQGVTVKFQLVTMRKEDLP